MSVEYLRQLVLECVVFAAVVAVGTDVSAVRVVVLALLFPVVCIAVGLIYELLMARFVAPKCPDCGRRHAPHEDG